METLALHEEEWAYVQTLLPLDLEASARATGALLRCRNVPDAAALLRMALAYAVTDLSLKDVAAWASSLQLAEITGPGLFYRFKEAERWLEHLLAEMLAAEVMADVGAMPIRIVDATVINGPGDKAVQWRAHVLINPATGGFRRVELTDDSGGEKLSRHVFDSGDVVLGDRAYGTARGLNAVREVGAHAVVRITPCNVRTFDEHRQPINLVKMEDQVPTVGAVEYIVTIPVPPQPTKSHKIWKTSRAIAWIPARAIAGRTRSGDVIWIVTTLDAKQLPALQAMALFRLRWQIELFFKRLKSLLHLDTLPSREGPTARSWILARLIAAALAQRLCLLYTSPSPRD